MPRCKACNVILDVHECKWNEERKQHEDLCLTCRSIIVECELYQADDDLTSMYLEDTFDDLIPPIQDIDYE